MQQASYLMPVGVLPGFLQALEAEQAGSEGPAELEETGIISHAGLSSQPARKSTVEPREGPPNGQANGGSVWASYRLEAAAAALTVPQLGKGERSRARHIAHIV